MTGFATVTYCESDPAGIDYGIVIAKAGGAEEVKRLALRLAECLSTGYRAELRMGRPYPDVPHRGGFKVIARLAIWRDTLGVLKIHEDEASGVVDVAADCRLIEEGNAA